MEAYQEPGNDVEGNQAVYGKALPRGTQADGAPDTRILHRHSHWHDDSLVCNQHNNAYDDRQVHLTQVVAPPSNEGLIVNEAWEAVNRSRLEAQQAQMAEQAVVADT